MSQQDNDIFDCLTTNLRCDNLSHLPSNPMSNKLLSANTNAAYYNTPTPISQFTSVFSGYFQSNLLSKLSSWSKAERRCRSSKICGNTCPTQICRCRWSMRKYLCRCRFEFWDFGYLPRVPGLWETFYVQDCIVFISILLYRPSHLDYTLGMSIEYNQQALWPTSSGACISGV